MGGGWGSRGMALVAENAGGAKNQLAPPSDKGVKMFEMAQFKVFTPDVKKGEGGQGISGSFAIVGGPWGWGTCRRMTTT